MAVYNKFGGCGCPEKEETSTSNVTTPIITKIPTKDDDSSKTVCINISTGSGNDTVVINSGGTTGTTTGSNTGSDSIDDTDTTGTNDTTTPDTYCSNDKVLTISRIGNQAIIAKDNCTFDSAPVSVVDLSTFIDSNDDTPVVTKISSVKEGDVVKYYYTLTDLKTGETTTLPIDFTDTYITSGSGDIDNSDTVTKYILNLVTNTNTKVPVDISKILSDAINGILNKLDYSRQIKSGDDAIREMVREAVTRLNLKDTSLNTAIDNNKITGATYSNGIVTIKTNVKDFPVDISGVNSADKYVHSGTIVDGNKLKLVFNDGSNIEIDMKPIITANTIITFKSGRLQDKNLVFTLSDDTELAVDISTLFKDIQDKVEDTLRNEVKNEVVQYAINEILNVGYTINSQAEDYTTQESDFNAKTIIRGTKDGDQTITITKPSDNYVGKTITIRKAAGGTSTSLTLATDTGVTILPADISPLRRIGNTVTLVYTGSGVWDAYGELP